MKPEVSVLLPIHGDCPHLVDTLESLESQTFANFEIIIIDDRASSPTLSIAHEFLSRLTFARIVTCDGVGLVAALNTGIKESGAELILRIDSDDYMLETRIQKQIDFLNANSHISVVGSQMILVNTSGKKVGKTVYPTKPKRIAKTLLFQNCVGHPSVMFRKQVICEVGGYDIAFEGAEDYELWTRVIGQHQIWNLPSTLTSYRISDSQFSKNLGSRSYLLSELIRLKLTYPDEYASIFNVSSNSQKPLHEDLENSLHLLELEIHKTGRVRHLRFQKSLSALLTGNSKRQLQLGFGAVKELSIMFFSSPANFMRLVIYAIHVKSFNLFSRP